jgi:alkanesulfonate monooxygenase SsuD/methylene tetrahydromethanopterin reductase-like flavin-dependent oxidoreductase (luciferase family)
MPDPRRLSFGIKTSQFNTTYAEVLRTWQEADEVASFEHAWLWDHFIPVRGDAKVPTLEAWTLLAALAARTSRLRFGVVLTDNRIRPPAVLAKMAATLDQISGGRLIFGIGSGGSAVADPAALAMVHREFDAYGIDVVSTAEAIGALAEACTIVRRMWTETEPFDFDGRYYRLKGALCEPKPVQHHVPILIGAGGEKVSLRVVAEHADIWLYPARTADEFRHKSEILDEHCAAVGRDPGEIARSVQVLLRPDDFADPARTRAMLLEFAEAGATHFVLGVIPPSPSLRRIADEVIEPVRAQAAAG